MDNLHADYQKASFLLDHGEFLEGLEVCDLILQAHPNFGEVHHFKGVAFTFLGRDEEALNALKTAIRLDPTLELAYYYQEGQLCKLGLIAEALQSYKNLLKFKPESIFGHCRMSIILFELKRYAEALASINLVLTFDLNNSGFGRSEIEDLKNHFLETMGQNKKVIARSMISEEIQAATQEVISQQVMTIVIDAQEAENYIESGMKLFNQGNFVEALANFEEAQALNPLSAEVHQNKATSLYRLKRFSEALEACETPLKMLVLNEESTIFLHQLKGEILYAQGEYEEALNSFQESLDLDPNNLSTQNSIRIVREHLSDS
jgi:tetratricopeptide (TPR) repeat protein